MQAQIEIRRNESQLHGLVAWMAALAVVVALLAGIGFYAANAGSRSAAPAQVTSGQARPDGATQQPQHGSLAGDDAGSAGAPSGTGHGQLP